MTAWKAWCHVTASAAAAGLMSLAVTAATAADTVRVSIDNAGAQGNRRSQSPELDRTGRFVAFYSEASNLVTGDTNNTRDVFVHDRQSHTTERISVSSAGVQGNGPSGFSGGAGGCPRTEISANGRWVVFESAASNLVAGDTNNLADIFVRDRLTGQTERVSLDGAGNELEGFSSSPSISRDGRFVAFTTANAAVPEDTNFAFDVFIRDRIAGTTERVSVGTGGIESDGLSDCPSVSTDGRYVAFRSLATNLVPGDTNDVPDVFVRDRVAQTTQRVSVDSAGGQGDAASGNTVPRISGSGLQVAFGSSATNLVPGDTNGAADVFVRDLQSGVTSRVSVAVNGAQATNGAVGSVAIDDIGRYVGFRSASPDLVADDANGLSDAFVKDRLTGMIRRVSLRHDGGPLQTPAGVIRVALSGSGRFAAWDTDSSDLVADDTNDVSDIFVRDLPSFSYEYAAKVVCGTQADPDDLRLAPGLYATTVNIHNPRGSTEFFKKLALTAPSGEQRAGPVYPIAQHVLQYDEALAVDCNGLRREVFGGRFPAPAIEGFLVVQSTDSLDLTAVYTTAAIDRSGQPVAHSSIDVRRIPERRRRPTLRVSKSARYFCNGVPIASECTVVAALYTVVVGNDGAVPATAVVLTDSVSRSDGLAVVAALAAPYEVPPGAVYSVTGPSSVRVDFGELAAGQEVQLRFWALAVINPSSQPDELVNRAEVTASNADADASAVIVQTFD